MAFSSALHYAGCCVRRYIPPNTNWGLSSSIVGTSILKQPVFHGITFQTTHTCHIPAEPEHHISIGWFKGKITGNSHISWENLWFPVDFPLNQPIDYSQGHQSQCPRPSKPSSAAGRRTWSGWGQWSFDGLAIHTWAGMSYVSSELMNLSTEKMEMAKKKMSDLISKDTSLWFHLNLQSFFEIHPRGSRQAPNFLCLKIGFPKSIELCSW